MTFEGHRSSPFRRFRQNPEFWILLVVTLISVPVLQPLASASPALSAILVLALFMLPGASVVSLLGDRSSWVERLALAFVASLAVCGIVAQVAIFAHVNIMAYVWAFAVLTAVLAVAAVVKLWRAPASPEGSNDPIPAWLVVMVLVLAAGLLFFQLHSPMDGDQFDNLGWIQSIIHDPRIFVVEPRFGIAPISPRFLFSAWFVQQAMMSVVSGIDPANLVGPQQLPLILLTLAAMFYLARRVTGNRAAAAWTIAIWSLYLLLWNEGTVPGYEIIVRSSLDKVVGGFIVVPVALGLALDYFNRPQRKTLVWLFFAAIAAALTHPITGALLGLGLGGFAVAELLMHRNWLTFWRVSIVTVILLLSLVSSFYLLLYEAQHPSHGVIATSLTDTRDPSLFLEISGAFNKERILVLDNGWYILHPRLILQLINIPAFLALPILYRRMRRTKDLARSHSAQFLLGMIVFTTLLLIFPPTAQFLGTLVTPSLLYRLAWPLSIGAALTVGWLSWEGLQRISLRRAHTFAFASLVAAIVVGAPQLRWSFNWLYNYKANLDTNYCQLAAPLLHPFQSLLTKPTVVLGDSDPTDFCLIAYSANARVVEFHGTNGIRTFLYVHREDEGWARLYDAMYYQNAEFVDSRLLGILKQWNVGYLIVQLDSPLEPQLRLLPGNFRPVLTALNRRVYQVISTAPSSPVIPANSALTAGQWDQAIQSYRALMTQGDPNVRYLAAIGLGRAYLQSGQLDSAITAWRQATAILPEAQPYALLGEAYAIKLDTNSALKAFQQAVARQPANPIYQTRLGDMYQSLGQTNQAAGAYQAAAAQVTAPGTPAYYSQLGQLWSQTGATDQALAAFNQSNQILEDGPTYEQIGRTLENAQRWTEAEQAFQKMTSLDIWDWNAHSDLADLYSRENDSARAISEYLTSLRLNPITFAPYQGLAQLWSSQQGQPAAIRQLENLAGYRLGFGPAVSALAMLHDQSGRPDLANADAQRAVNWYQMGVMYHSAAASSQLDLGNLSQSQTLYQGVLGLNVENDSAYSGLAQIATARGDMASAEGYLMRAIMAAPYSAGSRVALGNWYQQQGQPDRAQVEYQAAADHSLNKADGWTALGEYQLGQGKFDQALQSFKAALAALPSDMQAMLGVGLVQQNQGQVAEATQTFSNTVHLQPGVGQNQQALASLLIQQGKTTQGADQLKQASELDPGDSSVNLALGALYQRLGRTGEAESVYQQLLSNSPMMPGGYVGLAGLLEQMGSPADAASTLQNGLSKVAPALAGPINIALGDLKQKQGTPSPADNYLASTSQQPTLEAGYVALSHLYSERGDFSSATRVLQQGLGLLPGSADLNIALASVQIAQGNDGDAERTYQKVLALAPNSSAAVIGLAELYASTGHPGQALEKIDEAQKQHSGDPSLLVEQVNLAIALGQPQLAQSAATQLTTLATGEATSWIAAARAAENLGQSTQAVDDYRTATRLEPGNAQAWLALGEALAAHAGGAEAKAALNAGIQADHSNVALHLALAQILLQEGNSTSAITEDQLATKLDATQSDGLLAIGRIEQQAGQLQDALRVFAQALAASPTDPDGYKAEAGLYLQQGLADQANQKLVTATQIAPGSCEAYQNLGDFLAMRGDSANALNDYQRALTLSGCAASAHIALGNLYQMQAKPDDAISQYRQATAAAPGDAFAYAVLGNALTMQLRWNEANAVFADALTKAPGSDLVNIAKGRSLIVQGKLQDGLAAMTNATKLQPKNAMDWVAQGNAAQALGQLDDAEKAYLQAAQVDASLPDPQIALGDLYSRQTRNKQAQAAYQRAIAIAPGVARTYDSLGAFLESQNQNDQAVSAFRQGVAADKGQIESLLYLGRFYQQSGQTADAEQAFRQALSVGGSGTTISSGLADFQGGTALPSSGQAYIGLGNLSRSQADPAAAQFYQKAIQLAPSDPNGYINLGLAYAAQGRTADAQAQFQKATEVNPISAQAYVDLGDLYQGQGDLVAAQAAYLRAIGVSPASASGYVSLGRSYQTQGQKDTATAQLAAGINAAPASPSVYVALGDLDRARGNWSAAEQDYIKAMAKLPRDTRIYIGLGETYEAETQWAQAIAQFQKATQLAPASADGYLALGDLYRERADWPSAQGAYEQAIKIEPLNSLGYIGLAQTFLAEGLPDKAMAEMRAATQIAPGSAQAWVAQGDLFRLQANWKSAEGSYQKAIRVAPTDPSGYLGLGMTFQAEGLNSKALEQYQTAVKVAPTSGPAYTALGDWYRAQADWKNSQAAYQQAMQVAPDEVMSYVGLAQVYQAQGKVNDAVAQLKAGIDNAPTSPDAYLALGNLYGLQGNGPAAKQTLQQAVKAVPSSSRVHVAMGDWFQSQGDSTNAEKMYRSAIDVAPAGEWKTGTLGLPYVGAYVQLGSLYASLGRNSDAMQVYQAAVKAVPGSGDALVALGDGYQAQADPARALQAYQQAVSADPTNSSALTRLGHAFQIQGRLPDAAAAYQTAVSANPGNAELLIAEGDYDLSRGQVGTAIQMYQRAAQIEPGNTDALTALAKALEWQAKFPEAEQVLNRSIAMAPGLAAPRTALGDYYAAQENWSAASGAYREALAQSPSDDLARQGIIKVYLAQNQAQAAAQEASRWAQDTSGADPQALVALGAADRAAGDMAGSEVTFRKMITYWPGNVDGYLGLAQTLQAQGQFNQAVSTLGQALAIAPNSPQAYVERGSALEASGRLDEAMADYRQAGTLDASLAAPLVSQAELTIAEGDQADAIQLLQKAVSAEPTSIGSYVRLKSIYLSLHWNQNAVDLMNQAIQDVSAAYPSPAIEPTFKARTLLLETQIPDGLEARFSLSDGLTATGDMGAALGVLNAALPLYPKNQALILTQIAQVYGDFNLVDLAHQYYQQAKAADPNQIASYLGEGSLYLTKQNNVTQAIDLFEQAAQVNGSLLEPYAMILNAYGQERFGRPTLNLDCPYAPRLVDCSVGVGDYTIHSGVDSNLEAKYQEIYDADPNSLANDIRLAAFYQAFQLYSQAITYWQRVVQMDPTNSQALMELGRLYERQETGRTEAARDVGMSLAFGPDLQEAHNLLVRLEHNRLSSPTSGAVLTGTVQLNGTANSDRLNQTSGFAYYKIEIGTGDQPTHWTQLALSYQPVANGLLATWNTYQRANGTYTIRLTVVDKSGNYGPWQDLTVQVKN